MNRVNELIKEYCPDGVEIRCLEDCCNLLDKKRKPITKAAREAGEYPYYGANGIQDYVANYIFDGTFVLVGEDGSVITKSGTLFSAINISSLVKSNSFKKPIFIPPMQLIPYSWY